MSEPQLILTGLVACGVAILLFSLLTFRLLRHRPVKAPAQTMRMPIMDMPPGPARKVRESKAGDVLVTVYEGDTISLVEALFAHLRANGIATQVTPVTEGTLLCHERRFLVQVLSPDLDAARELVAYLMTPRPVGAS